MVKTTMTTSHKVLHPFASLTPSQIRAQPHDTSLTESQQSLLTSVQTIVSTALARTPSHITLPELQTIMDYKLSFGQNRPALRALIKKNSDAQVTEVSSRALAGPVSNGDWSSVEESMSILCELKGVGPATASLILSLLYPTTIPFFSDEATVDILVPSGSRKGIRYTNKTYKALFDALGELAERVNQNATDDSIHRGELERAIWHTFRISERERAPKTSKRAREEVEEPTIAQERTTRSSKKIRT